MANTAKFSDLHWNICQKIREIFPLAVETSVANNSSFLNYPHLDDHAIRSTNKDATNNFPSPQNASVIFKQIFLNHLHLFCLLSLDRATSMTIPLEWRVILASDTSCRFCLDKIPVFSRHNLVSCTFPGSVNKPWRTIVTYLVNDLRPKESLEATLTEINTDHTKQIIYLVFTPRTRVYLTNYSTDVCCKWTYVNFTSGICCKRSWHWRTSVLLTLVTCWPGVLQENQN